MISIFAPLSHSSRHSHPRTRTESQARESCLTEPHSSGPPMLSSLTAAEELPAATASRKHCKIGGNWKIAGDDRNAPYRVQRVGAIPAIVDCGVSGSPQKQRTALQLGNRIQSEANETKRRRLTSRVYRKNEQEPSKWQQRDSRAFFDVAVKAENGTAAADRERERERESENKRVCVREQKIRREQKIQRERSEWTIVFYSLCGSACVYLCVFMLRECTRRKFWYYWLNGIN